MLVKLLTEHNFKFLSLTGGWSESTLVKMSYCWKSHAVAQFSIMHSSLMWGQRSLSLDV